jgi:hypothetical protein
VNAFEAGLLVGSVAGALLAETIAVVRAWWRRKCAAQDASSRAAIAAYRAGTHTDDEDVDGPVVEVSPQDLMLVAETMPDAVLRHSLVVHAAGKVVEKAALAMAVELPEALAWVPPQRGRWQQ